MAYSVRYTMKIYFAHPCFNKEQELFKREFLNKLSKRLAQIMQDGNIVIVDPFLHTPNVEDDIVVKLAMSKTIMHECLRLLEESDVMVALADGNDTGTAFEAGYAHSMNIPVILVSENTCDRVNAMLIGVSDERFDNVLEEKQIEMLAHALERHYALKVGSLSELKANAGAGEGAGICSG
ncbi:MAG: hypothetical protein C0392_11245 [Syntrophus sp. (in: bacteria)]|nr:hypothetical protein [Syntrophus sp. (in: bacteria)]